MKNNGMDGAGKITTWFIVGFLVLVVGGVIVAGAISGNAPATDPNAGFVATTAPAITAADWTMGDKNAKVSLIEYGDFQCPACGEYYPIVNQLLKNYGNNILFVFRNFPLYTIHPDAGISAQAAEAAGLQGKFWDMYNMLYQKQLTWTTAAPNTVVSAYFDGYAQSLGLDVKKFDADINSSAVTGKIQNDVNGANTAAVDHTPTFFVNLKQIPNPASYDQFKAAIDQAFGNGSSSASSTGK